MSNEKTLPSDKDRIQVNVHNDIFGNAWARFVFGPAMFLLMIMLLFVTALDYRATIVFDNNQQIIAQALTGLIQDERRRLDDAQALDEAVKKELKKNQGHDLFSVSSPFPPPTSPTPAQPPRRNP